MADRKETPDVLGALLGETPAAPEPVTPAATPSTPPSKRRRSGRTSNVRSLPARQRQPGGWEYQLVILHDYGGLRPRFVQGTELPDWKRQPDFSTFLMAMGEEGWELAGMSDRSRGQVLTVFKRPKA